MKPQEFSTEATPDRPEALARVGDVVVELEVAERETDLAETQRQENLDQIESAPATRTAETAIAAETATFVPLPPDFFATEVATIDLPPMSFEIVPPARSGEPLGTAITPLKPSGLAGRAHSLERQAGRRPS